jgi:phenylpyruvate tautomerase PptA (4-oxalocrotonate tautomerase family)
MPYLKIVTNQEITDHSALLKRASQLVAEQLGKPERYVMVESQSNRNMLFAGSSQPLAYLELKSIGLPAAITTELSAALATLMKEELGISKDRVYIEFNDAPRNMWGWNGSTF